MSRSTATLADVASGGTEWLLDGKWKSIEEGLSEPVSGAIQQYDAQRIRQRRWLHHLCRKSVSRGADCKSVTCARLPLHAQASARAEPPHITPHQAGTPPTSLHMNLSRAFICSASCAASSSTSSAPSDGRLHERRQATPSQRTGLQDDERGRHTGEQRRGPRFPAPTFAYTLISRRRRRRRRWWNREQRPVAAVTFPLISRLNVAAEMSQPLGRRKKVPDGAVHLPANIAIPSTTLRGRRKSETRASFCSCGYSVSSPSQALVRAERHDVEAADSSPIYTAAADTSGESGASTSASNMADEGGRRSAAEASPAESGAGASTGGGTGGGSGGGDRQSSSSASIGKAGAEIGGRRHHLRIVQQPTTGCAFGNNVLSRLAVAPPLIVQLRVTDGQGKEIDFDEEIPFLVCRVRLTTDNGTPADMLSPTTIVQDGTAIAEGSGAGTGASRKASGGGGSGAGQQPAAAVSMLYGTLVASPARLLDRKRRLRTFFIFPEISIRSRGRFCLDVTLWRLPLPGGGATASPLSAQPSPTMDGSSTLAASASSVNIKSATSQASTPSTPRQPPSSASILASTSTEPFDVVLKQDYRAPHITELTRHFAQHGVGLLLPPTV